jgi:hypothetical protein
MLERATEMILAIAARQNTRACCLAQKKNKYFKVLVIQQAAFVGEGDSKFRRLYCRFGVYSGLAIHLRQNI